MKPLFVLLLSFILASFTAYLVIGESQFMYCGNIAMCVMLLFTAIGHFKYTRGMAMMLPDFIPYKIAVIYSTALLEIVLGLILLIPLYQYSTGIAIIIMFVLMLPANISAARRHVSYEKADYTGKGPAYLWFRVPMQVFLIVWVLYFSILRSSV